MRLYKTGKRGTALEDLLREKLEYDAWKEKVAEMKEAEDMWISDLSDDELEYYIEYEVTERRLLKKLERELERREREMGDEEDV